MAMGAKCAAPSFAGFFFQRETLKAPLKIHSQTSQLIFGSQTYQPTLVLHFVPFVLLVFSKLYHIEYPMNYGYQTTQLWPVPEAGIENLFTDIYIYMYIYARTPRALECVSARMW